MGGLWSRLMAYLSGDKLHKIVMVGLDNAGKTTALYKLHLGEVVVTQPTVGSNVEQLTYRNLHFEVWDLGGQERLRPSWSTYFADASAVILVVDSTDRDRVGLAKDELFRLLSSDHVSGAVLLVLANKQDLKTAMSLAEVSEYLDLASVKSHNHHIQSCCALTGEGLVEGLEWIAQNITRK